MIREISTRRRYSDDRHAFSEQRLYMTCEVRERGVGGFGSRGVTGAA